MRRQVISMFNKGISAEAISFRLQLNLKTVQIWIFEDWADAN